MLTTGPDGGPRSPETLHRPRFGPLSQPSYGNPDFRSRVECSCDGRKTPFVPSASVADHWPFGSRDRARTPLKGNGSRSSISPARTEPLPLAAPLNGFNHAVPRHRENQGPPIVRRGRRPLTRTELSLLIGLPLVVCVGTAAAVALLVSGHKDPATQCTIAATVLTGCTVVVAAVGLPVAVWQLLMVQRDQERIAAELAAKPELDIALRVPGEPHHGDETTARIPWSSGPAHATGVTVELRAANRGQRSARNPHWTISFPPGTKDLSADYGDELWNEGQIPQIVAVSSILNPGATRDIRAHFAVTQDTPDQVQLECRASSEDALPVTKTLRLNIERLVV